MSDFLLELFSEEIPARLQDNAAQHLHNALCDGLHKAGLSFQESAYYYTPRRLTLHITGLDLESAATSEEKRGPKTSAPEQALNGFLKSTGLSKEALEMRTTPKGEFYFAVLHQEAKKASDIIAAILPDIIYNFPWPKSMRWGESSLKWVRPLHHIICLLDQEVINFSIDTIQTNNFTYGHRFLAPEKIEVTSFDDYKNKLEKAYVILDQNHRKKLISEQINSILQTHKDLEIIEDQALLQEVTGLVEYPIALLGDIHQDFQNLPPELLTLTMKSHQKYFSVRSIETQKIIHFITISNMKTSDDGALILNGNQRVLAARLGDAQFFYNQDIQKPLLQHGNKLKNMTCQAKLGSQVDRISRILIIAEMLSSKLYPEIPQDKIKQTILRIKCDLTTDIVGEFPELQGVIGKYYARAQGTDHDIAEAIEGHYLPKGAGDNIPKTPLAIIAALADRLDLLCGFWVINEKPTGSKDPFALRRAALGIVRILHGNQISLDLLPLIGIASNIYQPYGNIDIIEDLFQFFHERLKVYLKDFNIPHDYIQAVLFGDNFTNIINNAQTLNQFLQTQDGQTFLDNYKRAVNIVKAEEKKDQKTYEAAIQSDHLTHDAEKALSKALQDATLSFMQPLLFEQKLQALSNLNILIQDFFDHLIVNDDNAAIRINRLNILGNFRELCHSVCEFAKIEG